MLTNNLIVVMSVSTSFSLKTFGNIVKNILRHSNKLNNPLGRWKLYDNKNIGLVVDYSNEDHCGTCSNNTIMKFKKQHKQNFETHDDEMYKYDYICLISNNQGK
jgi:hypothetical protein